MKFLMDNWFMLVLAASLIVVVYVYVKKFLAKPTEEQIEAVRHWLLLAVTEAEKKFGSGTGAIKLRAVYAEFCKVFPDLIELVPFIFFSDMVDTTLKEMRRLLETNKDIKAYVEGK